MDDQCMRYAPPDPGFWEKVGAPLHSPVPSPRRPASLTPPYPDSCSRVEAPPPERERERRGR